MDQILYLGLYKSTEMSRSRSRIEIQAGAAKIDARTKLFFELIYSSNA
jgi:hypothetical protein